MKLTTSEIKSKINKVDLFICSSGFESRSKSFALTLDIETLTEAYIFNIDENYNVSYENIEELKSKIPQLKSIQYPKNNPIKTYDIILDKLDQFYSSHRNESKINLVIDVTTFTREVLLILIKAINQKSYIEKSNIYLVYTPAKDYPCDWLTKGIRNIRSIFGYSGMALPSKKLMLIVLNGFESERTEEIINSFEPNAILLGSPSSEDSINNELNSISKAKCEHIKYKYLSNIKEEFEFSCIVLDKTINVLEKLITQYGEEYNIVISPLNNKVSTVATAIVALKNDNVQVCYASANQYNINDYSVPCDYFLIFDMNKYFR